MNTVSALIPSYNRGAYVGGAIETVLNQTHDSVEAVVVNDGSTDHTREVLSEYARNDQVRVHHNDRNRGIAYSFNRAAELARGDLLCVLGDDDRWHPRKVQKQVDKFDSSSANCGVVYTGGVMTHDGLVTKRYRPRRRGRIYPEILTRFALHPHSGHMVRREAFEAVGGFDAGFPRGVDWDLAIRLAKAYEFEYVPDPLVKRVYHGENVSDDPAQVTVWDLVARKYATELARHPETKARFRTNRKRSQARTELKWGNQRMALRHSLQAFRMTPSIESVLNLALVISGTHGFQAAAYVRRHITNAMSAP